MHLKILPLIVRDMELYQFCLSLVMIRKIKVKCSERIKILFLKYQHSAMHIFYENEILFFFFFKMYFLGLRCKNVLSSVMLRK